MADTILPTAEQEQRAKWDLLLLDIEHRQEQVRSMKAFENWRFVLQVLTVGAAIGGAAGVWIGLFIRHTF
jgi:hypothetical protein